MDGQHEGDGNTCCPAVSIAAILNGRPRNQLSQSFVADLAFSTECRGRAKQSEVMERLDNRNAHTKTRKVNRWREAREEVVNMDQVWFEDTNAFAHFLRVLKRINTLKTGSERIQPAH